MLIVLVEFEVEPELRTRFVEDRRAVVARTLKEPGCIAFGFSFDAANDRIVHLVERWRSAHDLAVHIGVLRADPVASDVPYTERVVCFEVEAEVGLPEPIGAP